MLTDRTSSLRGGSEIKVRWLFFVLWIYSLGVAAETRIGLGSCFNQEKSHSIWRTIGDADLDGFLFLGDNVYASHEFSRERLISAYERADAVIPWDRLGIVQATWDDHDFGQNDGGASFSQKSLSLSLFWQFFGPRMEAAQVAPDGVYNVAIRTIEGHEVQFIALDTRSFRGRLKPTLVRDKPGAERYVPNSDIDQSMLGEAQWKWFEEQLQIPADIRIVMSSIQVIAEGHGWERWGNLPHERKRLLDLLRRRSQGDVLLVSGDRHIGGIYQIEHAGERFTEITSSGLNMAWTRSDEYLPNQIGAPVREDHFAVLSINNDGLDKVVWHDNTGSPITSFKLN